MISVLCPSRQRPLMLKESIDSLGDVEAMVWLDKDDPLLDEYKDIRAKIYIRERVGYKGFGDMVNFLANHSTGDWLMLWNDDAIMHTPNWQDLIPEPKGAEVLNIYNSNPEVNLFPLISREFYNALGHYSHSAHCDSWVQDIANKLGIHRFIPGINIEHRRDYTNDPTKQYSQSMYKITSPIHNSKAASSLMDEDLDKIRRLL